MLGDFFLQAGIGIILGYAADFVIAHEKYDFLPDYTQLVTLMAMLAAFLGADNLHASGFMAVFVLQQGVLRLQHGGR